MFQLSEGEYLRSHFATSIERDQHGGRRYQPYAFTEQGIAMLSAVLRSDVAVNVSIQIMDAFVEMHRFLTSYAVVFERLDRVELKQHIFFDGQIYDAFSFIVDIIKKAKNKLILIDNYVDTSTLNLLCKKKNGVSVVILSSGKVSLTS